MQRIDNLITRRAARIAAEDKILDLAARKPATVVGALLAQPDVFRELHDDMARTLILSLLDRGQADALRQLLGLRTIGRRKATWLAELLLADAFGTA